MFSSGDQVMYGVHGVCQVLGTEMRTVDHKRIEYYVLVPVEQPETRCYVPTQNQTAVAKMRKMMTSHELELLLRSQEARQDAWIPDENQRKLRYRALLGGGDRAALLSMVHTLYKRKAEQAAAGRKFHLCDENFLRDAQRLLDAEFSTVLHIQQNQVAGYILNILQAES